MCEAGQHRRCIKIVGDIYDCIAQTYRNPHVQTPGDSIDRDCRRHLVATRPEAFISIALEALRSLAKRLILSSVGGRRRLPYANLRVLTHPVQRLFFCGVLLLEIPYPT